jgi:TrmH family RNA methyltransferase
MTTRSAPSRHGRTEQGSARTGAPSSAVTFALVASSEPGNAGAAARSLTAFGFRDLRLIDPATRPGRQDAALAVRWGQETLRAAQLVRADEIEELLGDFDEIWGTTCRRGSHRELVTPREAVAAHRRSGGRLLILFGPERDGLSRTWLDRCRRLVRIPTPGGPLNLAHAVTVIAYELRREGDAPAEPAPRGASSAQRREILRRAEDLLAGIGYPTRSLKRHPPEAYLEPVRGGRLPSRQAQWLLGLIRRLEQRLAAPAAGQAGGVAGSGSRMRSRGQRPGRR